MAATNLSKYLHQHTKVEMGLPTNETLTRDGDKHQLQYPLSPPKTLGRSEANLTVSSPNRVLAQANHALVNTFGSSF